MARLVIRDDRGEVKDESIMVQMVIFFKEIIGRSGKKQREIIRKLGGEMAPSA